MTTVLRCRNPRHLIPNSNLAFIRYFAGTYEKSKDSRTDQVLHNSSSQLNSKETKLSKDSCAASEGIPLDYPEEPTTCCMSGCANCVWLDYAEKISAYYKDGGDRAIKEINERVSDTNIKAFLLQELRTVAKTS